LYFIYKYFRYECYCELNLWEGVAKEFAGILGYKQSLVPHRSRNTGPVRCRGTDFYGRGPLYVSPFVTVSSVESNVVSDAVKFPDLDSFDSLTRSTYPRHDDNWMKLGRAC